MTKTSMRTRVAAGLMALMFTGVGVATAITTATIAEAAPQSWGGNIAKPTPGSRG